MPRITIDGRDVQLPLGGTILDAARLLGIEIPTMCHLQGHDAQTSCMVCVVKVDGNSSLVPACGAIATEGMRVENDCPQVLEARRAALELLLSDHLGDCMGPCQIACPAHMNIPLMIRQIAAGRLDQAIATVKADIALPAVLGRICPAPCEKTCRRSGYDDAVSICLLKRFVADTDLAQAQPHRPQRQAETGKSVAIVGAGPAGLAAAYYLRQAGFACTIFDEHEEPGGMLRYGVPREALALSVLDAEIATITGLGVQCKLGAKVTSLDRLRRDFDAVFVAIGAAEAKEIESLGLHSGQSGIAVDKNTYETNIPGVFAGGDAVRNRRLAVRSVADGKEAAIAIGQYMMGRQVTGPTRPFNSRTGRIEKAQIEPFLASASREPRVGPADADQGFAGDQAQQEALRCLHCDCRKPDKCKLRDYSQLYEARQARYKGHRRSFTQDLRHPDVIYEPGKCVDCGICVRITAEASEELGLTFVGRGFDVRVAVPFDRSLAEGLRTVALECVRACPTGALALRDAP